MTDSTDSPLNQLDIPSRTLERLNDALARRNGAVLVTGSRGSGRTTTFLGCIDHLAQRGSRVMLVGPTSRSPVDGVLLQTVENATDSSYCAALRLGLGRSPDVVAVADLGGTQVAQLAFEAASMNHLVIGRLRAAQAAGVLTGLLGMGVDPYLLRHSLTAILAQRLVRRLCPACREAYRPDADELKRVGVPQSWKESGDVQFFRAKGCDSCGGTGFVGRCALFQLLAYDDEMAEQVESGVAPETVEAQALRRQKVRGFREEGLVRCTMGVTTPDELARSGAEDD